MSVGRFLGGVAALIQDPDSGRYLLLKRAAHRDFGAGQWECVTGRVDQGEGFAEALEREVREELGVEVRFQFFVGTTHFYRGEPAPETELLGLICACTIADPDVIEISAEHSEHHWLSADEIRALLPPEHWLRHAVERAEMVRMLASPELLSFLKNAGLNLD